MSVKVKCFDEEHETILEDKINEFLLQAQIEIIDIKYQVSSMFDMKSQIYCFSAMIIYKETLK